MLQNVKSATQPQTSRDLRGLSISRRIGGKGATGRQGLNGMVERQTGWGSRYLRRGVANRPDLPFHARDNGQPVRITTIRSV